MSSAFPLSRLLCSIVGIALLAGCGSSDSDQAERESDPALTGALEDEIMTDAELSGEAGAAAATADGIELPPEMRSPEAIAAAKQEAAKKAGGTLQSAPQAAIGTAASLVQGAATAARVAEQSKLASTDCASKVNYSASWANRLPDALAVYPRGALQEAAGADEAGCAIVVANFVTPVDARDVIDYYYTRARKAGYGAEYHVDGSEHVLGGKRGAKVYVVSVRKQENGLTGVDVIASGK
jgi:hypothetical protein